jgi:hypothetical protein
VYKNLDIYGYICKFDEGKCKMMPVSESLSLPIFYIILTNNQYEGHFDFLNSLCNDNSSNINEMGKEDVIIFGGHNDHTVKSV